jgi:hypothetical protein
MSDPVISPDGKFMWTGSEWIPAPPSNPSPMNRSNKIKAGVQLPTSRLGRENPSFPNQKINLHDSVIGGDINYSPQVHHNVQNVVHNNIDGGIINPGDDLSEVVEGAYKSGKKALRSVGYFILFIIIGIGIGSLFDDVDNSRIDTQYIDGTYQKFWLNDEGNWVSIEEKPFDNGDYFPTFAAIAVILWLGFGIYIFVQAGPIGTYNRVREHYPASPTLERGDKGKNMHDVAKYAWLAPLVIIIIVIIIGIIVMKIAAEMDKNKK